MQCHQRLNKTKIVMFNYSGITIYEKKVRFEYLQSNRTLYEKYKINFPYIKSSLRVYTVQHNFICEKK